MKNLHATVRVGDRVRVRRQRWSVVDARSYDGCQVLTLMGIGPLNAGRAQHAIAPFDVVEPIEAAMRLRIVRPRQWRRRCRVMLATARDAGSLTTPTYSRIDLMPHQLEPALAIVRGLGSRVLIADEVGLGKTIQAGLILSELRARGAAERVLVIAPAGLREQWASELRDRFGLDPAIVDMAETRRLAARLPVGINPWVTLPLAIASIDFTKRPEVLPSVHACRWDVVVVDEAHGVTPGSDRHRAVNALCARAPYVVLLTATPHNGNRAAFESLCRVGALAPEAHDKLLVFRRSRRDVALGVGRRIHKLLVRSSPLEIRMHDQLARFATAARAATGRGTEQEQHVGLTLAILHKRAMSSAHSLHASVARRLATLSADRFDSHRQLTLPLDDGGGEFESSDEVPAWTAPAFDDPDRERRMLTDLAEAARTASAHETKLATLADLLSRLARRHESAIVFTEYRDTLAHVQRTLALTSSQPGMTDVIHGGLTREERRRVLDDFQNRRVSILLATDAGGEGLNLHHGCRVVINLELPWNPMRLEQRIGRVDRIGQSRRVHAFNLIARDTGELRVFDHLKARLDMARQDIAVPNPLESPVEEIEGIDETRVLGILTGPAEDLPKPAPKSPEDRSGSRSAALSGPRPAPQIYDVPTLTGEAEAEYTRLTRARTFLSGRAGATAGAHTPTRRSAALIFTRAPEDRVMAATTDTWFAFARHPNTRSRLAPDVLALLQSTLEDRLGRVVAVAVVPLAVRTAERVRRESGRRMVLEIIRTLEARSGGTAAPGHARALHDHFWSTRLARERAIAAALLRTGDGAFQPGLFDRRAEEDADRQATLIEDARSRVAAMEWAASLGVAHTNVALVLFP